MKLNERFELVRPLEQLEINLAHACVKNPQLLNSQEEAIVRTALALAKLYKIHHAGREVGVGLWMQPFRESIERQLGRELNKQEITRADLLPHLKHLKERVINTRGQLTQWLINRVPEEAIDRELRNKSLALVLGGGGGTAYVQLGAMSLLDEYGIKPKLIAGTSMGSVLGLFRSQMQRFEREEILSIVRSLSWSRLFRVLSMESRFGVPAALRLYLRAGIGRYFGLDSTGNSGPRLKDLPIKTIIAVSGIRQGKLPHPLDFYEQLMSFSPRQLMNPMTIPRWFRAIAELAGNRNILTKLHLGADDETSEFDALDAAGFSSALPGVIHYDVLREDPHMSQLLAHLFATRHLSRLIDGGLTDNVPSKAAWLSVHKGSIQTRNVFVLALNGFAPKLGTPLWLPLQQLAELNVKSNRKWAHVTHDFKQTLGALEIVPSVDRIVQAIQIGQKSLSAQMPFIARMMAPLPRVK
jgi:predicted acylesterase/phospholipase RssA